MARMVVLVNGLPGAGKSTLAAHLASALELPLLTKDVIKEAHADVLGSGPPPGLTQRVWNRRLGTAASETMWALLGSSTPGAVLESSWRADVRAMVEAGLRQAGVTEVAEVWCEAPLDELRARFSRRWPSSHPIHGAEPDDDEWARMVEHAESLGLGPVLRLDTSSAIDIDGVVEWCRAAHADPTATGAVATDDAGDPSAAGSALDPDARDARSRPTIVRPALRSIVPQRVVLDPVCISCTAPEDDPNTFAVSDHWKLVLHPDQTVPGALLIVSLRHVPKISELTTAEAVEFIGLAAAVERALEDGLGASMVNFSCLRNWAFREVDPIPPFLDGRPNPHVHWHVAPRFARPVTIGREEFIDSRFCDELLWEARDVTPAVRGELIQRLCSALAIT